MKKIIIVVVALVVVGGGVYFLTQKTPIGDEAQMAMIESAFFGRGSVVCTFVNPETEYMEEEKVTIYIKNGNLRIFPEDAETIGGILESALFKDGVYYLWAEDSGMKLTVEEDSTYFPFYVADDREKVYFDEGVDVSCRRTSIDNSMFEIPKGVEFFDMGMDMMDFDDYDYTNDGEFNDFNWQDYYDEGYDPTEWSPEMLESIEGLENIDMNWF